MKAKWLMPTLPYAAVLVGVFIFKNAWATLLGFHAAILLALFILKPVLPVGILLKTSRPAGVFLPILIGALGGIGLYTLWKLFHITPDLPARLLSIGLNPSTWAGFIVYFSLVNPFIEEYFWRGVLGSDVRGFYIGDLVYAGYHALLVFDKVPLLSVLIMLAVLTFIGWFWRQLYRRDGGLLAPVIGHMAADFTILLAVCFMAS